MTGVQTCALPISAPVKSSRKTAAKKTTSAAKKTTKAVKEGVSKEDAEKIAAAFKEVGATCEIK